ncbi:Signal peptidase complex subunit 2 [Gurleya vavrai]
MDKIIKKYNRTPIKTDISTLKPIKITIDDVLSQLLRVEHNYKQSHLITDFRIIVGLISTGLAAFLTYLSVYQEFKIYKETAICILVSYFFLNGVLEIVMRYLNKGCIFQGTNDKGTIKVYSNIKAPDTNYILMVYRNGKDIPEKFNKNVCDLFNEEGLFLHEIFINEVNEFLKMEKKDK